MADAPAPPPASAPAPNAGQAGSPPPQGPTSGLAQAQAAQAQEQANQAARERGPDGKFLPRQGQAEAPPAPKRWKLADGEEYDDPDILAKRAGEYRREAEESRSYKAFLENAYKTSQEAERMRQELEADPLKYLREKKGWNPVEEGKRAFLEEMERRQKYAGLPPEMVADLERLRAAESERDELRQKHETYQKEQEQKQTESQRQYERLQLVGTLRDVWSGQHTRLPQSPLVLELAAREYAAMKLAGMQPDPARIGRMLEQAYSDLHSAVDTDEAFDAKAFLQKYPKRAEAIRLAAVEAARFQPGQSPSLVQGQRSPLATDTRPTDVDMWIAQKRGGGR